MAGNGSWRTGVLTLKDLGFKQSKKIRAIERKLWAVEAEIEYDHETDTHARSGEFGELLRHDVKNIKNKADGREIFASPDEEWFTVYFFFGSEDEIVAKLEKLLAKQKRANKNAKFTDTLSREVAEELGNKFADVPGSGLTWHDQHWYPTSAAPRSGYFERNDGWTLRIDFEDKTVKAHYHDITVSGDKSDKELTLNTVEEVEAFIKKLGPDIPKRPPTCSETAEEALYQLVKGIIGDFECKRDQGSIYFGPCHLSRERVGDDKGKLYLSIGDLSAYGEEKGIVGYMTDDVLKKNLIAALPRYKLKMTNKIEWEQKTILGMQQGHIAADALLTRLGANE